MIKKINFNMKKTLFIFSLLILSLTSRGQALHHAQGEILVQVKNADDLKKLISQISPLRASNTIQTILPLSVTQTLYKLQFDYTRFDENEVLAKILSNKRTLGAQFNHFIKFRDRIPSDTLFKNQWQWLNNGLNGKTKGIDVKASRAWHATTGGITKLGKEIVVAVIDDGTESIHPDLKNNIWINQHEVPGNKIDDDANGYVDDYYGWNVLSGNDSIEGGEHGVSVNGLIGGQGNNITGVSGINWNVKMMNLKYNVRLGIKESDVITAYSYVLRQRQLYNASRGATGAFIVASNASWGIDDGQAADAPLWCAIYDSLGQAGILNVSAADNRVGINVDSIGDLPTLCPSDFLLSVTSIESDGKVAGASGPKNIDIAAPGNNIFTTRPDGKYGFDSGTSFAAPIVTGAIGLLYANLCGQLDEMAITNPAAAALLVKNAIMSTAVSLPSLNNVVISNGYLNVLGALDYVQKSCMACSSRGLASRIYIDSLVLDGMRFRSRDNFGYGGFTNIDSLMPMINIDGQMLLKVYPISNDSLTQYYLRVWIDRNLDNDFDDTAELAWDSGPQRLVGPIVSNIYLPPTAIDSSGQTTIRIALKAAVNIDDTLRPGPCDFFNAGEVEDYTIKLLPKSYDCPDALELVSSKVTENSATIFYQKIIPKLFYFIRYREASSNKWDTLPTRDTMVMLTMLKKCTDYVVESKTICDSDTSRFKTMLKFKTTGCTVASSDRPSPFNHINVFPNPFTDRISIRFDLQKPSKQTYVRMVNINGSLVQERSLGTLSSGTQDITLYTRSGIPAGMYLVHISNTDGTVVKKVVKAE